MSRCFVGLRYGTSLRYCKAIFGGGDVAKKKIEKKFEFSKSMHILNFIRKRCGVCVDFATKQTFFWRKIMRKLVFSVVAIVLLATSALFAQDETPSVRRTINGYLTADSGDIIGGNSVWEDDKENNPYSSEDTFGGHEMEIGLSYTQNFASAEWLSMRVRFNAVMTATSTFDNDFNYIGQAARASSTGEISPRGQVYLAANGSGFGVNGLNLSIALDTRMKSDIYASYGLAVGPGRLTFNLGAELYVVPLAATYGEFYSDEDGTTELADTEYAKIEYSNKVLDLFVLSVGYSMKFTDVFGFNTTVYARFVGADATTYYDGTMYYEDGTYYDSSSSSSVEKYSKFDKSYKQDSFIDNLELRWDLNMTANFAGGLGMWAGIRLDVENLAYGNEDGSKWDDYNNDGTETKPDVDLDLKLRAGISYTFSL